MTATGVLENEHPQLALIATHFLTGKVARKDYGNALQETIHQADADWSGGGDAKSER